MWMFLFFHSLIVYAADVSSVHCVAHMKMNVIGDIYTLFLCSLSAANFINMRAD